MWMNARRAQTWAVKKPQPIDVFSSSPEIDRKEFLAFADPRARKKELQITPKRNKKRPPVPGGNRFRMGIHSAANRRINNVIRWVKPNAKIPDIENGPPGTTLVS
jgi:hypothetical protein